HTRSKRDWSSDVCSSDLVGEAASAQRRAALRESAGVFGDGEQIGQDLARVVVIGQRVDHRDARMGGHLLQGGLGEGAPYDRRGHPAQHAGGVGDGLTRADLCEPPVHEHRVSAQLGDSGGEGGLGAQGGFIEDHGHRLRAFEGPLGEGGFLQGGGPLEYLPLLRGGQVVIGEEVAQWRVRSGHELTASVSSAGRAVPKGCACWVVRMDGGASRMASGATGLMMNPARMAAWASAAAWGPARPTAISRPEPRTSVRAGWSSARIASRRCSPTWRTWVSRSSRSI